MQPLLAIVGPTASGKTALAVQLAEQFSGELVSADAKQLFIGMDIGTNKEQSLSATQHLIDVLEPGVKPTVYWYQQEAYRVIDEVAARGNLPILVGGSMLYAESVLKGYVFSTEGKSTESNPRYRTLALGITVDRELLRQRIADRTLHWLDQGLLLEITNLLNAGVSSEWLRWCGLEYKWFTAHILGECTLEEAIVKSNQDQWQYIRRQYTWWRRYGKVVWVDDAAMAIEKTKGFLSM